MTVADLCYVLASITSHSPSKITRLAKHLGKILLIGFWTAILNISLSASPRFRVQKKQYLPSQLPI